MVAQLVVQLLKRAGWQNLLMITLLSTALVAVAITINDFIIGLELPVLLLLGLAGLLLGWLAGSVSRLPGWLAGLILLVIGLEAMVVYVANLETPLFNLAGGLGLTLWQLVPPPTEPLTWPFLPPLNELTAGLDTLLTRLLAWLNGWISDDPVFDPVVGALVWSVTMWSVAAWAGGVTRRTGRALLALLPAALVLAVMMAYHPRYADRLLVLVVAAIPLIGLTEYANQEKRWQISGIDAASFWPETLFTLLLVTGGLLGLATLVPSVSVWELAQRLFREPVEGRVQPFASALGLEGSSGSSFLEKYRAPGLPRQHLLGSGPELSQEVVLLINTGETPRPPIAAASLPEPPRYYWRGLTYDRYTGRGWFTSPTRQIDYQPGDIALELETGRPLRQTVQVISSYDRLLYAAGAVVAANRPYSVLWRGTGDQFLASSTALSVTVESRTLTGLTADELRAAGSNYPGPVRQRYLSLPGTVPARVLALARELTATRPTPYDRAKAIESYLRAFPYSLNVSPPPRGSDVVDYFLFSLKTGYCDYYATAMVVLARAAGLPARLAVGYAPGRFDPIQARHIITAADAHSWPEIYFPGYGWVEFEPTAALPVNNRSVPELPEQQAQAVNSPPVIAPPPPAGPNWLWPVASATVAGLLLIVTGGWLLDGWRLRRLPPAALVQAVYQRLQQHGVRLAIPTRPGDTPFEFASMFIDRVQFHAAGRHTLRPIPTEVNRLTQLYVQTAYSNHPPQTHDKLQCLQLWRSLRRRLWVLWLLKFINRRPAA